MSEITIVTGKFWDEIDNIASIWHDYVNFDKAFAQQLRSECEGLRNDLWVYAEFPYVDKVYRDSYYSYYSSKHFPHQRDCIRLAFFACPCEPQTFQTAGGRQQLQYAFLGVMVIRPLPAIIGRSMLSPLAFTENRFRCATVYFELLINGVKMKVKAFPHSSQNTETMTCAETSVWTVVEYFANKYPEYSTILPSRIHRVLEQATTERQVPSKGLFQEQISFALKQIGFGPRLYMQAVYRQDFKQILQSYVEAGIPVVAVLSNGGAIGHASVVVGHEAYWDATLIAGASASFIYTPRGGTAVKMIDVADLGARLVFVDDNYLPYRLGTVEEPCLHYPSTWHGVKVIGFVAPLYTKIYLDAVAARAFVGSILSDHQLGYTFDDNTVIRVFLTSSRSFKAALMKQLQSEQEVLDPQQDAKNELIELFLLTSTPKFIWVAEFACQETFVRKEVDGWMAVDATEAGFDALASLIMAVYPDGILARNKKDQWAKIPMKGLRFDQYLNNLKDRNEWQYTER